MKKDEWESLYSVIIFIAVYAAFAIIMKWLSK